jgi:hypothetical protein
LKKNFAGHGRKECIAEELESKDWIVEEFCGILILPFFCSGRRSISCLVVEMFKCECNFSRLCAHPIIMSIPQV